MAERIDWLRACRRMTARIRVALNDSPSTGERAAPIGPGEGGDTTLYIDKQAEDAVFVELEALHDKGHLFAALSEERGRVDFGAAEPLVVIDPLDGSLNAKRALPFFTLSIAVASGSTTEEVEFGYVYDFGAEEEFWAARGRGAEVNGQPLLTGVPQFGLEVVAFESANPKLVAPAASVLAGRAYRLRIIGTIALALSYVAAGRVDGLITLKRCRSVDVAAAQLIASEAGACLNFSGLKPGEGLPLDLRAHSACIAARTPEHLAELTDVAAEAALAAK